ncbi:MAG: lactoylglutathione lyase [Oscillibacter sp.]|nr:lactoylglutathione lyase [Oscillibacter sp.]
MTRVHHIGYLVKHLEKSRDSFLSLDFQVTGDAVYDEYRDVDILFMEKDGYTVELVSPRSDASVVARLIKTYKNAPYHICYETDDLTAELARLENSGFTRIDDPAPAPALGGRRVCFLMSARIGMIELLEESGEILQ